MKKNHVNLLISSLVQEYPSFRNIIEVTRDDKTGEGIIFCLSRFVEDKEFKIHQTVNFDLPIESHKSKKL